MLLFCIVGSYAINNSTFEIWVMLAFGALAFILEGRGFPIAPIILGIVLGPLVENNFLTSMVIARGDMTAFFDRPIAAALGVFTLSVWILPPCFKAYRALAGRQEEARNSA